MARARLSIRMIALTLAISSRGRSKDKVSINQVAVGDFDDDFLCFDRRLQMG